MYRNVENIKKTCFNSIRRLKRYKWCKERLNWDVEEWSKVIFNDESNFQKVNRKSRVFVKRLRGEQNMSRFIQPRIQDGGGSVGIWGCISHKGAGVCHTYTSHINRFSYKNTLENCLLPSKDLIYDPGVSWIFQQDGAKAHTPRSIKEWFHEQGINDV